MSKRWMTVPTDWLSDRPGFDLVLASSILGIHLVIIKCLGAGDFLTWLASDRRADLYGQAASTVATLGGLAAIGLAIYQSAAGDRSRAIRVLYGRELRKTGGDFWSWPASRQDWPSWRWRLTTIKIPSWRDSSSSTGWRWLWYVSLGSYGSSTGFSTSPIETLRT